MATPRVQEMMFDATINGDTNMCGVIAYGVLSEQKYQQAYDRMKTYGRRKRKGTRTASVLHALRTHHDYRTTEISGDPRLEKAKTALTMGIVAKKHFPKSKLLVLYQMNHLGAFVNGINHDWTSGRKHHIARVWLVE